MTTVTKGDWCVSYTIGGDIPKGKVELNVYCFKGEGMIKAPEYGQIMTRIEAEKLCLEKGYLQEYKEE